VSPAASSDHRAGLTAHAVKPYEPGEVCRRDGLPLTAPLRTLADLASVASEEELERAAAGAQLLRLVTRDELATVHRIARLLDDGAAAPTRSELERAMLRIVTGARLPRPLVNARAGPYEVDFLWPAHRVIVETDGWHAHGHRRAFERDRARDAELQALGYVVVRFTWRQVRTEPLVVAARLGRLLTARTAVAPG
jgi:very-short-patch-repair endonuclease